MARSIGSRALLLLPLLLLFLVLASLVPGSRGRYRNLYGSQETRAPMSQLLTTLTFGGLKFLRDGEESLASELPDLAPRPDQEFDFVVVGAGSAGATIAARLAELPDVSVLLLEAGRSENLLMDIPVLVNYLQMSDDINWKYRTEPAAEYCRGMTGQQCNWPRGKVMGGSSVLNYMIATRGEARDYDSWAAQGNEGWSFEELLPYFKKLEEAAMSIKEHTENSRGKRGPVHIEHPPYHTPLATAFLRAGVELGYPLVHDYIDRQDLGFSYIQATIKNGSRVSTNRAYLYPSPHRPNLHVSRHSHVGRVLIDKSSRKAYGVEYTKQGRQLRARARKEVILCAGAIGTPQLLMLSGVGPAKHLRQLGIEPLRDAPVGKNLMDHIAYGGLVFLVDQPVSIKTADLTNPMKPYLGDFLMHRSGPLTVPGGCEALAFVDVDRPPTPADSRANRINRQAANSSGSANVELLFIGGSIVSDSAFRQTFGISEKHWRNMFEQISGYYSWTIFPMLMHPRSRGEILLRSRDPADKPRIYANYLDDPEDVRVMVKAIRESIRLSKTKAMRQFDSRLYEMPVPGCENHIPDSDQYWECAARTFTFTIYHYSGTCKMAPEHDPTGVVNPRLQVKGIKGLRVADASIMPNIMTGHPNIPIIMIGEKLADMVKEDWGYKT